MKTSSKPRDSSPAAATAAAAVFAVVLLVYSWSLRNGFVNWDDNFNIVDNPHLRSLSWANLKWMATSLQMTGYTPLTWLLYGALFQAFGPSPAAVHAAAVLLHALSAALIVLICERLCRGALREVPPRRAAAACGAAALLWALDPMQTQAVCWASSLNDPLAAALMTASLWLFLRGALLPSLALFLLAGLTRWTAACLPLWLLAVDVYPLKRIPGPEARRAGLELCAYFAVAALPVAATLYAKRRDFSPGLLAPPRLAGARVLFYLRHAVWPTRLLPIYGAASLGPASWVKASPWLLLAATACLAAARRRRPAALSAWLCFLAAVAPPALSAYSGPLPASDHFAYAALAAFCPILAWALSRKPAALAAAAAVLLAMATATAREAAIWRDSVTLWKTAVARDPSLFPGRLLLGLAYLEKGEVILAVEQLDRQRRAHPEDAIASRYLLRYGDRDEALEASPGLADYKAGVALRESGRLEEAAATLERAVRRDPALPEAWSELAAALLGLGRAPDALASLYRAFQLDPYSSEVHNRLGIALAQTGWLERARWEFSAARALDRDCVRYEDELELVEALQKTRPKNCRDSMVCRDSQGPERARPGAAADLPLRAAFDDALRLSHDYHFQPK